jgi:hypothetical protein
MDETEGSVMAPYIIDLIVVYLIFAPIIATELLDRVSLNYFDPKVNGALWKKSKFEVVLYTVLLNIIMLPHAVGYWTYRLCKKIKEK